MKEGEMRLTTAPTRRLPWTVKVGRTEVEATEGEADFEKYAVLAKAALHWWRVDIYKATPGTFLGTRTVSACHCNQERR